MSHRFAVSSRGLASLLAALIVAVACSGVSIVGQAPAAKAPTSPAKKAWTPPRTAWGEPDLQGKWSYATITPLERPVTLADRETLSDAEVAELNEDARTNADRRDGGADADLARAYNAHWYDRGKSIGRTSLIVDPPDGRLPPMTAEGRARQTARAAEQAGHEYDSWENRPLPERCITYHGVPPLPTGYNNTYQIFQTPGFVVVLDENIHDVRTIPLDGRPHLGRNLRPWVGDSRGHWEGNTLVVDTTNYSDKIGFRGAAENLHVTERFTRVDADTIRYEFTVDDPTTWTQSWSAEIPMKRMQGPLFEYACTEGNYGLANILRGARVADAKAEAAAKAHSN
jgi:hypothetical protein